jgi:uncharacterized protein
MLAGCCNLMARLFMLLSAHSPRLESQMHPEPLADADFERMTGILQRFGGKRAMNVEELDGFLAALVCSPDNVPKSEYLPHIWGDKMINEDTFVSQPVLQEFLSLVERHRRSIVLTLQSGDVFTPVLLPNEKDECPGNDWANGFLCGMNLGREQWANLLDDDNYGGSLVPILVLAHEHDPDPEMRPYKEPISAERREKLIVGLAAGVMQIHRYFRSSDMEQKSSFDLGGNYRRTSAKAGRNDPCPCGSGKKFKHCCGKTTLH